MNGKIVAIRANLPNLEAVLRQVESLGRELPYTQEAVKTATEVVQRTWIEAVSGVTVSYSGGTFKVNVVTGDYIRSIVDGLVYPALGDKLTGEVSATSPHARYVEDGIRPFDMKQTHLHGPKAKISKKGTRYVTIPFRHNTPGNTVLANPMPQAVYERAKRLAISRRNGLLMEWYQDKKYEWGERMEAEYGGPKEKPHWSTGRYTGMVRMNGGRQTTYLTFRRISENSKPEAWKHPGVPPRPVTEAVVEMSRKEVTDLIKTGFEVDLASLNF